MESCERHLKPVQAFCEDECQLLCVDCLIEHARHKAHKIENLDDASRKTRKVIENHLAAIRKVENSYHNAFQKSQDFKVGLDQFRTGVANKVRMAQLKALKVVTDAFMNLGNQMNQKLLTMVTSANKMFAKNDEEYEIIQRLRCELDDQLANSQLDTVTFLQYYTSTFSKYDIERLTKRMQPNNEPFSYRDLFNENTFTFQEIGRTLERIKQDLFVSTPSESPRPKSRTFFSKRDLPQDETTRTSFDDLATIAHDQQSSVSQSQKDHLKKAGLNFNVSSEKRHTIPVSPERISSDLRETQRRMTSPLCTGIKVKPPSEVFQKLQNRNPISFRQIPLKNFTSNHGSAKIHSIRELLNPALTEQVLIIGGQKSKNFSIKFLDFSSGTVLSKKINFPPIKKQGSVISSQSLFLFGGKMNNKPSDKIYRYNPKELSIEEQTGFTLTRKKYDFAWVQVDNDSCLLFGGKDERGFAIADIEHIDFSKRVSKVIGRMSCAKSGMIAVKVDSNFGTTTGTSSLVQTRNLAVKVPPQNGFNPFDADCPSNDQSPPTISFNVSGVEQRLTVGSNFNYSFDNRDIKVSKVSSKDPIEEDLISHEDQSTNKFEISDYSIDLESDLILERASTKFDFTVLIIGGQSASKNILNTVDIFYPKTKGYQLFTELLEPRKSFCVVNCDNGVFVFGGRTPRGLLKSIERVQKKFCKNVGTMSIEKEGFRGLHKDGYFWLISGEGYKGTLDFVECLQLDQNQTVKFTRKITGAPSLSFYELLRSDNIPLLM